VDELIKTIREELNLRFPIEPDTPLLSSGLIGSLYVAALLSALESRYKVHIEPREVGTDNFDTAEQMYRFLQARI
jgi:acyl carrier protein